MLGIFKTLIAFYMFILKDTKLQESLDIWNQQKDNYWDITYPTLI